MFLFSFDSPDGQYRLVIEDDGKVAYAYLERQGSIISDVWLYNRAPAPEMNQWEGDSSLPFLNSVEYVKMGSSFTLPTSNQDFEVEWVEEGKVTATVYVKGKPHAILEEGITPGRCVLAKTDGPLAKVYL